jgi:hypothetical protein
MRSYLMTFLVSNLAKTRLAHPTIPTQIIGLAGGIGNICLVNKHTRAEDLNQHVKTTNETLNDGKPGRRIFGYFNLGPEKVSQCFMEEGYMYSTDVSPTNFILFDEDAQPAVPSVCGGHGDSKYSILLYLNFFIAYGEEIPHMAKMDKVKMCEELPIVNGTLLTYPHASPVVSAGLSQYLQGGLSNLQEVNLGSGEFADIMNHLKGDLISDAKYFELQRI